MKYTLIAFKPEDSYWCGGDKEIHSAELIREDNLTREEIVNKIFELSKDPEYVYNRPFPNCPYNEFHIFEYKEENIETQEESDDIYWMKEEARKLAFDFNNEGRRKQKIQWAKEEEIKAAKELEKKRLEYEKLKREFENKQ